MAGPGWQVEALNLKKEIKSNIYVKQLLPPNLNQIKEGGSGSVPFNCHQVQGCSNTIFTQHTQLWQKKPVFFSCGHTTHISGNLYSKLFCSENQAWIEIEGFTCTNACKIASVQIIFLPVQAIFCVIQPIFKETAVVHVTFLVLDLCDLGKGNIGAHLPLAPSF